MFEVERSRCLLNAYGNDNGTINQSVFHHFKSLTGPLKVIFLLELMTKSCPKTNVDNEQQDRKDEASEETRQAQSDPQLGVLLDLFE